MIGSREYVNHLSKEQRAAVLFDVNIDCMGLTGPTRAWAGRSDSFLLHPQTCLFGTCSKGSGRKPGELQGVVVFDNQSIALRDVLVKVTELQAVEFSEFVG